MKTCPQCNRLYPDTETFCASDGTALVREEPAFTEAKAEAPIECPVCGGRAQPGEVICNFCGARLTSEEPAPAPQAVEPQPAQTEPFGAEGGAGSRLDRETGSIPPSEEKEEEPAGRRMVGILGYVAAAAVALAGGIWLALRLSSQPAREQRPVASVAASPLPEFAAPTVSLASTLPVQVLGDAAAAPERNPDAARREFEVNKGTLLEVYNHALATDSGISDAMMVRLGILPDGSVDRAAVRTSTAPNPSLDAAVVKAVMGWRFAAVSAGQAEADYPLIFAHNEIERVKLESELQTKLASLSPTEAPEYASAPAASPSPLPEVAALPPPPAVVPPAAPTPAVSRPRPRPAKKKYASVPRPAPSLYEQVGAKLKSDRRFARVKAYTSGGTVTLYGRVFDDNAKRLAERAVKEVPGVTGVVDSMTTDVAQWAQEQDQIARQLQNAGLDKVTVKVIGQDAYLNGQVKTELEKQRAVTIAEGAAPVTVRENLIRVEPGSMFGF